MQQKIQFHVYIPLTLNAKSIQMKEFHLRALNTI